jgi:uncharacterized protein
MRSGWAGAGRISSIFTRPCSLTPGSRRTRRSLPGPTRALLFEKTFTPADPHYSRPRADCYASGLKGELDNALSAAAAASGGTPVRVNKTVDATETFKFAAIRRLAEDSRFQAHVRSERGIKWGRIQHLLADHLPETFGQQHDDRSSWVFRQGLVKRALDEILGGGGWRSESRDGSQWIVATDRAKSRSAVPPRPVDRSPDDDLGPPPDEPLF